jgi:hypothetical protein
MNTQIYFDNPSLTTPNPRWSKGRIYYSLTAMNLEPGDIIRVQYSGRIWENIPETPVYPNGPRGPFEAWRITYQETILVTASTKLISKNFSVTPNNYVMRAVVYRNSNIIASSVKPADSIRGGQLVIAHNPKISAPTNFNVINGNILNWNYSLNAETDLPIKNFIAECMYVLPIKEQSYIVRKTVTKNLRQYLFENIKSNNNIRFRIIPLDVSNSFGNPSPWYPSDTTSILFTGPSNSNLQTLFDLSFLDSSTFLNSFNDMIASNCIRAAIEDAANRWNTFIRFNPTIYDNIRKFIEFKSNNTQTFKGIRCNSITVNPSSDNTITCIPNSIYKISNTKINTIDYKINISINEEDLVDALLADPSYLNTITKIFTHELGHVLGIGTNWTFNNNGIFPYSLNGNIKPYPNVLNNYNQYYLLRKKRSYIPLSNDGTHFASTRNMTNRYTSFHPPITHDIMSNDLSINNDQIALISTKSLLDLGYEEVIPNQSEFDSSSTLLSFIQSLTPDITCGLSTNNLDPKLTIDGSNPNNIIFYDENLTLGI